MSKLRKPGREPSKLGSLVRVCREARGLSQREACRLAGIHQSVWSDVETGFNLNPGFLTIRKMLDVLDYDIEVRAVPRK